MQKRSSYDRAYEVCLQGRGYTVASTFGGMPPAPAPAPATLPSAAAGTPTTFARDHGTKGSSAGVRSSPVTSDH